MRKAKARAFFYLIPFFVFIVFSVYIIKNTRDFVVQASSDESIYALVSVSTDLTNSQKRMFRDALLEMGNQYHIFPDKKTHLRKNNNNQKAIIEVVLPGGITKAKVIAKLASVLPWTEQQIDDNSSFQVFGGLNATHEESRQAAVTYLIENDADWGTSESIEEPAE